MLYYQFTYCQNYHEKVKKAIILVICSDYLQISIFNLKYGAEAMNYPFI